MRALGHTYVCSYRDSIGDLEDRNRALGVLVEKVIFEEERSQKEIHKGAHREGNSRRRLQGAHFTHEEPTPAAARTKPYESEALRLIGKNPCSASKTLRRCRGPYTSLPKGQHNYLIIHV